MRRFGWAVTWLLAATGAAAQTQVAPRSEAQRVACLVKPAELLRYPERGPKDRSSGAMRLLLKFSRPDAGPETEVLVNTAREDMQDRVLAYVRGYRLPCLRADDGVVVAVQDFSLSNNDRTPPALPVEPAAPGQPPECLVRPRRDLDIGAGGSGSEPAQNVVAEITFKGDGQQAPEVKIIYAKAAGYFKAGVFLWASEYRMPCRTAQDKPVTIEQLFKLVPEGRRVATFARERFSLMEFLGLTREPAKQKAYFDLDTMGCPFKVRFVVRGGELPNQATVAGPTDPNKVAFLNWLTSLQLDFASAAMANELFGSELQVDIPCGVIDLKG